MAYWICWIWRQVIKGAQKLELSVAQLDFNKFKYDWLYVLAASGSILYAAWHVI
jgi:hypothetical protein